MGLYISVAIMIVILSSLFLALILNRNGMLNLSTMMSIGVSSVLISLLFPYIYSAFTGTAMSFPFLVSLFFTLLAYITLIFLATVMITTVIDERKARAAVEVLVNSGLRKVLHGVAGNATVQEVEAAEVQQEVVLSPKEAEASVALIEAAEAVTDVDEAAAVIEEIRQNDWSGLRDVPADLGQFPAAACVEVMTELEKISEVDAYIDTAFSLKEKGELEGAILHYMYALDQKPEDALVFWIILDICVLYKSLGQAEFAREILAGYVDVYGGVMDENVRSEIERNLM